MSERFRQFQAAFPEEACLATLMRLRHGGTEMSCPACGRPAHFQLRTKLRAFACDRCNYLIQPASGTPLESRRTALQLWFYALKLQTEQPGKAEALLTREAGVPQLTARRIVDELTTLVRKGKADWLAALRPLVCRNEVAGPAAPALAPLRAAMPSPPVALCAAAPPPAKPSKAVEGAQPGAASGGLAAGSPKRFEPEPAAVPQRRRSGHLTMVAVAGGFGCLVAAAGGFAYLHLQRGKAPPGEFGDFALERSIPALKDGPARPSLILSSVEQDLEGARQAAQFAIDNDPALAAIKSQDDATQQQVPVNQLQLPSNILLVPPKGAGAGVPVAPTSPAGPVSPSGAPQPPQVISSGDPDQILNFGPIKIRRHLVDTIVRASKVVGADPTLLMAVADKESSFSTAVKAQTSSATGLYQFIEQTWLGVIYEFGTRHGLASDVKLIGRSGRQFVVSDPSQRQRILDMRREPYISALLAAEMLKRDTLRLEAALGRHLTGGEIYLIHFLGPDAAQTFIETMEETPGVKAAELLPRPAQANRPIFYTDAGGETKTLSVSEVHKKFNDMIKLRLDRYSTVRPGMGAGIARPQPKK